MAEDVLVAFCTFPDVETARRIVREIVEERRAACGNVISNLHSVYRWQGKIERQAEILILAKTTRGRFEELEREVRALHSYDTPEIIAVPVVAGSAPYLKWLSSATDLHG